MKKAEIIFLFFVSASQLALIKTSENIMGAIIFSTTAVASITVTIIKILKYNNHE